MLGCPRDRFAARPIMAPVRFQSNRSWSQPQPDAADDPAGSTTPPCRGRDLEWVTPPSAPAPHNAVATEVIHPGKPSRHIVAVPVTRLLLACWATTPAEDRRQPLSEASPFYGGLGSCAMGISAG